MVVAEEVEATNLAIAFLEEFGESLEHYDGQCGELVDAMLWHYGEDQIRVLYMEPTNHAKALYHPPTRSMWRYHMVPVIGELVHDAWSPTLVLPPAAYVQAAFPHQRVDCILDCTAFDILTHETRKKAKI